MKTIFFSILIAAHVSGLHGMVRSSCTQDCNLVNTLVGIDEFSGLVEAVKAAGLVDVLVGEGPFTVFAPSDSVFQQIPVDTLITVVSDSETLKTLLLRHVVPGNMIMSKDIPQGETVLPTAAPGESITVTNRGGSVKVMTSAGSAYVVSPDIEATNGVVHKIDGLI